MTMPLFDPIFPPDLKGSRLRVASLLLDHRGKGMLTSREIAARLGWRDTKAADVRHIITELVDTYKLNILADRNQKTGGYAFAESDESFDAAQLANLSQAVTSISRIKARLGERKFRAALVKLKIREALDLEKEIA